MTAVDLASVFDLGDDLTPAQKFDEITKRLRRIADAEERAAIDAADDGLQI